MQEWYFYLVWDFTLQTQKPTQHSPKKPTQFHTHKCLYCLASHNVADLFGHATGKLLTWMSIGRLKRANFKEPHVSSEGKQKWYLYLVVCLSVLGCRQHKLPAHMEQAMENYQAFHSSRKYASRALRLQVEVRGPLQCKHLMADSKAAHWMHLTCQRWRIVFNLNRGML